MQLKHLFVFLLVLVISVADSTIYSQEGAPKYYESSKLIHKKRFSYQNTKHAAFNQNRVSDKYFLALFFPKITLKTEFQKQIKRTIKLQKKLYQKIALLNIQHTFLHIKITTSNSLSFLYIA
jgi:hypothetical protein